MATVNKSSLRAEFAALKARFESLCAEGKMSAESRALFDALLMLFEVLMTVFMEKHTPKSSANSSLPASQSPNDETARTRPGAKGKGPSYNDARYANTRTRESARVLSVDACQRCGEDLTDAACLGHLRARARAQDHEHDTGQVRRRRLQSRDRSSCRHDHKQFRSPRGARPRRRVHGGAMTLEEWIAERYQGKGQSSRSILHLSRPVSLHGICATHLPRESA